MCKILCKLTVLALYLIAPSTIIEYLCIVHTAAGHQMQAFNTRSSWRSLCLMIACLHLLSSSIQSINQSIKLQALVEFHYPPFQLPQELQLQHHTMVSHRPLRSGKSRRLSNSALIIATLHVFSATLLVTGSWQSPIRACTRKQIEANEIFVAVLLLLSQHRHAEPIRSEASPFLLIVCIFAFVSICSVELHLFNTMTYF